MSGRPMRHRIDTVKGTIGDLVDWAMQRGLDPGEVTVTACHLKWQSPETEDEAVAREQFQANNERRTEEWEYQTLARLLAKYPTTRGSAPAEEKL